MDLVRNTDLPSLLSSLGYTVKRMGDTVVLGNEKLENKSLDTLVVNGQQRSVIRDPSRDELKPCRSSQIEEQHKKIQKEKPKGRDR